MLKTFQIHAIQQALVSANLHYHKPDGMWDHNTHTSYQQFHATVLFTANPHLIPQPTDLTSVCAELLELAGLLVDGEYVDDEDDFEGTLPAKASEEDDEGDDDEGEGDATDPDQGGDTDPVDIDPTSKPEGSVILPGGAVTTVEQLQQQQDDPAFQLNTDEIADINRQAGDHQQEQSEQSDEKEEQHEQEDEAEPTAEELAAKKAQEEAEANAIAVAAAQAEDDAKEAVAKPVAKKKKTAAK